jgi:superfamily II DNA or RNA helicase
MKRNQTVQQADVNPYAIRGFSLEPWQTSAVEAWFAAKRGTLEIFTGGGKTLIALACIARARELQPGLRVAIAVPTIGLAEQWRASIVRYTTIPAKSVGVLGGGKRASIAGHDVVIGVLNSAAKYFPEQARDVEAVMLVVDECHRAGAPSFSTIFKTQSELRLGLSATPYRDEVAENGEPIGWDDQVLGRELGAVVYSFTLKSAREIGWLPEYAIHHHGVELDEKEKAAYKVQSLLVDSAEQRLRELGGDAGRAWGLQRRADALGELARQYIGTVTKRKDLVYGVRERRRITLSLIRDRLAKTPDSRILVFNERVEAATQIFNELRASAPEIAVALEHSALPEAERTAALDAFRSGSARILVSVKALTEGIDVPGADVGISVASSASVRQRVQLLGRVLRRTFDGTSKSAVTHLLYAADTVDTLIYAREDWSDLTGSASNVYFRWPLDADEPIRQADPPARPSPTEDQEHDRLGDLTSISEPIEWLGVARGAEYSMNTAGVVTNATGRAIVNPQTTGEALRMVRGRADGKFRVTPVHRYIVVWNPTLRTHQVAGQLREPFMTEPDGISAKRIDVSQLKPGDDYLGARTFELGTARITSAGYIKRKGRGKNVDLAITEGNEREHAAARELIVAWRSLKLPSIAIGINVAGHVWWRDSDGTHYLGSATTGLSWPTETSKSIGQEHPPD